jgi:hypothetical protein
VASSNTIILGFFRNNLAIEILCFSNQLSFNPLSHITVSNQSFNLKTKSAFALFRAVFISLSGAFLLAYNKLFLIDVLNKELSCIT